MTARLSVVLHGPAAELAAAQRRLADFLAAHGAGPRSVARAELLIEEVALNALRHGFADPEAAAVTIEAWAADGAHGLDVEDRGRPFDPAHAALPAAPAGLGQAAIGGLGLPLIRRLAAAIDYQRTEDGRNRLRLVLPPEDAAID